MENSNEIWQTSINGEIYEASFEVLTAWIAEGSLLPQDKVRRGNLRWIEASKVPALHRFFNARQFESSSQIVSLTNFQTHAEPQVQNFNVPQPFITPPPPNIYKELAPETDKKLCVIHADAEAKFNCETCGSCFCEACPQNSMCPMCGATCQTIAVPFVPPPVVNQPFPRPNQIQDVVVSDDFRKAANWCYWKAGLTVINSLIGLSGGLWAFFLGMTLPQFFQGFAIGLSEGLGIKGTNGFHIFAFVLSLGCAGFMLFLGRKSAQGKKWAVIWGLVIFAFDGFLYLLSIGVGSSLTVIFGIIVHAIAIAYFVKALQGPKS